MKYFRMFVWMTLLTGVLYPLVITAIAQLILPKKANGSLLVVKEKVIGSALIGQKFERALYFWPRPSASDYDPLHSGGSNLGSTSTRLKKQVEERRQHLATAHGVNPQHIPSELLFASGSGLDPHIGLETAYFQMSRVAKARGINEGEIRALIDAHVVRRPLGLLGAPYVNVFLLNLALDEGEKR